MTNSLLIIHIILQLYGFKGILSNMNTQNRITIRNGSNIFINDNIPNSLPSFSAHLHLLDLSSNCTFKHEAYTKTTVGIIPNSSDCASQFQSLINQSSKNLKGFLVSDSKSKYYTPSGNFILPLSEEKFSQILKKCQLIDSCLISLDKSNHTLDNLSDNGSITNQEKEPTLTRNSVLFVAVSFILLMVISLAWLVFYYVQRFRYIHSKERVSRRLADLAKKAVARIPVKVLRPGDKEVGPDIDQCAICIETYRPLDNVRILPCRHYFHKNCIDPWLLEQRSCPMCKLDILHAYGLRPDFNCGPSSGPLLNASAGPHSGTSAGMMSISQPVSPNSSQPSLNALVFSGQNVPDHSHHLYQSQSVGLPVSVGCSNLDNYPHQSMVLDSSTIPSPFSVLVTRGNLLQRSISPNATTTLNLTGDCANKAHSHRHHRRSQGAIGNNAKTTIYCHYESGAGFQEVRALHSSNPRRHSSSMRQHPILTNKTPASPSTSNNEGTAGHVTQTQLIQVKDYDDTGQCFYSQQRLIASGHVVPGSSTNPGSCHSLRYRVGVHNKACKQAGHRHQRSRLYHCPGQVNMINEKRRCYLGDLSDAFEETSDINKQEDPNLNHGPVTRFWYWLTRGPNEDPKPTHSELSEDCHRTQISKHLPTDVVVKTPDNSYDPPNDPTQPLTIDVSGNHTGKLRVGTVFPPDSGIRQASSSSGCSVPTPTDVVFQASNHHQSTNNTVIQHNCTRRCFDYVETAESRYPGIAALICDLEEGRDEYDLDDDEDEFSFDESPCCMNDGPDELHRCYNHNNLRLKKRRATRYRSRTQSKWSRVRQGLSSWLVGNNTRSLKSANRHVPSSYLFDEHRCLNKHIVRRYTSNMVEATNDEIMDHSASQKQNSSSEKIVVVAAVVENRKNSESPILSTSQENPVK